MTFQSRKICQSNTKGRSHAEVSHRKHGKSGSQQCLTGWQVAWNCIPLDTRPGHSACLRPLNTYVPVQSQASLRELSLVQNSTATRISPSTSVVPHSVSFHPCPVLVFTRHLEDKNRKWSDETVSTHKRIRKCPYTKTFLSYDMQMLRDNMQIQGDPFQQPSCDSLFAALFIPFK